MKRTLSFLYLFLFFLTRPWALELPEAENLFDKVFGSKEKESGRAIIQLRDGGYCLTGEKEGKKGTSLWVLRLDSKGKILWERVRGAHQKNRGLNLLETEDGGILVAGFRSILTRHKNRALEPLYSRRAWLLRFGPGGDLIWEKEFGGGPDDQASTLLQLDDNSFLVTGTWGSQLGLWRIDGLGNRLYSKQFSIPGQFSAGTSLCRISRNKFALGAYEKEPGLAWAVSKILFVNENGELLEEFRYESYPFEKFNALGQLESGEILIAGSTETTRPKSKAVLLTLSKEGKFNKFFEGKKGSSFQSLAFKPGGGFLGVGFQKSATDQGTSGWILGFNKYLEVDLEGQFSNQVNEVIYGVDPCWNGGYVFVGETTSASKESLKSGSRNPDLWVLRTDSQGRDRKRVHQSWVLKARKDWQRQALENFVHTFPDSPTQSLARSYLKEMRGYTKGMTSESIRDWVIFCIENSDSELRSQVLNEVLKKTVENGFLRALMGFIFHFPDTPQARAAWLTVQEKIWDRINRHEGTHLLEFFMRAFPLSKNYLEARNSLEKREYQKMLNDSGLDEQKIEKIAYKKAEQASRALAKRDFETAQRKLSLVIETEPYLFSSVSRHPMRIEEFSQARRNFLIMEQDRGKTFELWEFLRSSESIPSVEFNKKKRLRELLEWQIDQLKRELENSYVRWRKSYGSYSYPGEEFLAVGACPQPFLILCSQFENQIPGLRPGQ